MSDKTQQTPIHSYTEFLTLPDKEEVEITAESFIEPIFKHGDAMYSQIKIIRVKNKSANKITYSDVQLSQEELEKEVKTWKAEASKYKTFIELITKA